MGYESACTLTIDGRRHHGTARLELKDLTFRGDTRITIPLTDVAAVHARGDTLFVAFGNRQAVLALGADAEKWANRISHPPSRLDKLGVKAGMRVALMNLDDPSLEEEIGSRGAAIERGRAAGLDAIFVGVQRARDLDRLARLAPRLKPNGALWLIRAKGKGAAVSESASMAAGRRAGLVDVKVVSFSDTHSAEKYVIPVAKRAPAARSSSPPARTRGSVSSRDRR